MVHSFEYGIDILLKFARFAGSSWVFWGSVQRGFYPRRIKTHEFLAEGQDPILCVCCLAALVSSTEGRTLARDDLRFPWIRSFLPHEFLNNQELRGARSPHPGRRWNSYSCRVVVNIKENREKGDFKLQIQ